jgi:hypothetical protein
MHGWRGMYGAYFEKKRRDAERQKEKRRRDVADMSRGRRRDVAASSSSTSSSTSSYKTERDPRLDGLLTAGQAMEAFADAGLSPLGGGLHPKVAALAPWHPDEIELAISVARTRKQHGLGYGCGAVRNTREERDSAPKAGPVPQAPPRLDPITQSHVTAMRTFLGDNEAAEFFGLEGFGNGNNGTEDVRGQAAENVRDLQQAGGGSDAGCLVGSPEILPAGGGPDGD